MKFSVFKILSKIWLFFEKIRKNKNFVKRFLKLKIKLAWHWWHLWTKVRSILYSTRRVEYKTDLTFALRCHKCHPNVVLKNFMHFSKFSVFQNFSKIWHFFDKIWKNEIFGKNYSKLKMVLGYHWWHLRTKVTTVLYSTRCVEHKTHLTFAKRCHQGHATAIFWNRFLNGL